MCEGNRLLETGEWLVPFLISKKKKNLSISRLGSSGKKPWTLVIRDEDPLTSQKHRGLEGVREGSGDGVSPIFFFSLPVRLSSDGKLKGLVDYFSRV